MFVMIMLVVALAHIARQLMRYKRSVDEVESLITEVRALNQVLASRLYYVTDDSDIVYVPGPKEAEIYGGTN